MDLGLGLDLVLDLRVFKCLDPGGVMLGVSLLIIILLIINNNRRLVTLAEHTSDHGRQTNSSTEEKGEQV